MKWRTPFANLSINFNAHYGQHDDDDDYGGCSGVAGNAYNGYCYFLCDCCCRGWKRMIKSFHVVIFISLPFRLINFIYLSNKRPVKKAKTYIFCYT